MTKRTLTLLLLIGIAGLLTFAAPTFSRRSSQIPVSIVGTETPQHANQIPVNVGLPVRLIIPRLRVDAKIEYMGLTSTGAMDVPQDVNEAGWYKLGPHPGDTGSAVIAGHLDGIHGEPGIFLALAKLEVGDSISVVDDTGKTTTFVVHRTPSYGQHEQPAEVFHSAEGIHLNLITCTGLWNQSEKRFSKRLVVFSDKVN